jgi:hypothetical protein
VGIDYFSKSSPLRSPNKSFEGFTSLSTSKPLYDESPNASTKLLEEFKQNSSKSIFPAWPGPFPDFRVQQGANCAHTTLNPINMSLYYQSDEGESCNPANLTNINTHPHTVDLDKDKPTSLLKSPRSPPPVPDSPVISLASLDDMLSKYKRKYTFYLFIITYFFLYFYYLNIPS